MPQIDELVFYKLQTSVRLPADFLHRIATAAKPVSKRRYRPLFPLRAAALAEEAAAKADARSSSS